MKERILFDPRLSDPETKDRLYSQPILGDVEGKWWPDVWENWWGGATIASPTTQFTLEPRHTLIGLRRLVSQTELGDENALVYLNRLYEEETTRIRKAIEIIFGEEKKAVFETNGTSAIALCRALTGLKEKDMVLTTSDEGNLVYSALKGGDPWRHSKTMFEGNVSAFSSTQPSELPDVETPVLRIPIFNGDAFWRTDGQIISDFEGVLKENPEIKLVVLPQVTKTGRILPVSLICDLIRRHNETRRSKEREKIFLLIDGVQAVGRMDAISIQEAAELADFYVFTSSKALGAILASSAILIDQNLLSTQIKNLESSFFREHLKWFQFPNGEVDYILTSQSSCQAVSLPELHSFRLALEAFHQRGIGKTFQERRERQLAETRQKREELVRALRSIPSLEVLDDSDGVKITPSIVICRMKNNRPSAKYLKQQLQNPDLGERITPSAIAGNCLRFDIPEYRKMPSIEQLVEKLTRILTKG